MTGLTTFVPPVEPDAAANMRAPEHHRRAAAVVYARTAPDPEHAARIRAGRIPAATLREWGIA